MINIVLQYFKNWSNIITVWLFGINNIMWKIIYFLYHEYSFEYLQYILSSQSFLFRWCAVGPGHQHFENSAVILKRS